MGEVRELKASAAYEWDEAYVEAYLEDPKSKIDALRRAGHPNPLRPFALKIHNRCRERIDRELTLRIKDGAAFGYSVLEKLCDSDNDTVKLNAAKALMDYAGRKPSDVLEIREMKSEEELDKEIARLQKVIQDAEGKVIEGEIIE